jgi:hypothetical protein
MGGQVAIRVAAARPAATGLFVMDAGNSGGMVKAARTSGITRSAPTPAMLADLLPLSGTSQDALNAEIDADSERYDTTTYAKAIAGRARHSVRSNAAHQWARSASLA